MISHDKLAETRDAEKKMNSENQPKIISVVSYAVWHVTSTLAGFVGPLFYDALDLIVS